MKKHFDQQESKVEVFVREAHDLSGLSYLRNFVRVNAADLGQYGIKLLVAMYTSAYCFSYTYKPTTEEARIVQVCHFSTLSENH